MSEPALNVQDLLQGLATRRPLFHSEADFQHALAWETKTAHPDARLRLERSFEVGGKTINLDMFVTLSATNVAIELKYWKKRLVHVQDGEKFDLKNQGAHDISRYDFWKDVTRLEGMVEAGLADKGYAIVVTNDQGYWNQGRGGTVDEAFRMHEGREVTGRLAWAAHTGEGTMRGRRDELLIEGTHKISWQPYATISNGSAGSFRYVVLEVSSQPRAGT